MIRYQKTREKLVVLFDVHNTVHITVIVRAWTLKLLLFPSQATNLCGVCDHDKNWYDLWVQLKSFMATVTSCHCHVMLGMPLINYLTEEGTLVFFVLSRSS